MDASDETLQTIFGPAGPFFSRVEQQIRPRVFGVRYFFTGDDEFEKKLSAGAYSDAEKTEIVWREIINNCHLSAAAAILRNRRWIEAAARAYEARSLLGFAAAVRALIESIGDSGSALFAIPLTLAEQYKYVGARLKGIPAPEFEASNEVEEQLLHFIHGRKLSKSEATGNPPFHRAKAAADYVQFLVDCGVDDARKIYSLLCDLIHPARGSVHYMLTENADDGSLQIRPDTDVAMIDQLLIQHRPSLHKLVEPAFTPSLLMFRVLHRFHVFPAIPELKSIDFSGVPAWRKIERALQR